MATHHRETPWRPRLHFTPERGWLNDPNGLVALEGEHHLFYQHNPHDDVWGPMHWGHAVSVDLVHWEHLPIALHPDEHGWIYSGSAVIDADGTAGFGAGALVAVFTHADGSGQSQSLAWSTDRGRTFELFAGNPVLEAPDGEADFRDPRVFRWCGPGGDHWVMVLAVGRQAMLYTSADLRRWEPASELAPVLPGDGEVTWETPDLFPLRVEGTAEERWVLTLSAMSGAPAGGGGTCYLVGDFDGRVFAPESAEPVWADHGPDFYAPQTWGGEPGGGRTWVGWMGDWSYAQDVPSCGWRGVMSLPRRLGLVGTEAGPRLTQQPVGSVDDVLLPLVTFGPGTVAGTRVGADRAAALGVLHLECFDLTVELEVDPAARGHLEIRAVTHGDGHVAIAYDVGEHILSLDRGHAGAAPFHRAGGARSTVHLEPVDGMVRLRVVGDTCTTEVFGNDGLAVLSALTYPSRPGWGIHLVAGDGTLRYRSVELRGRPVHRVL